MSSPAETGQRMRAIDPEPAWRYESRTGISGYLSHVDFYGPYVIGQWFCLDAATGAIIWRRAQKQANEIIGVDAGVIVASEMMTVSCWTASIGCYGISLVTGELLWTSDSDGIRKYLWKALECIPGLINEFRDTPIAVENGEVICASGRILDIHNGRRIAHDRKRVERVREDKPDKSDAERLYYGERVPLQDNPSLRLSIDTRPLSKDVEPQDNYDDIPPYDLRLRLVDRDGAPQWLYSVSDDGYFAEGNFYASRYQYPYVYIIAYDKRPYIPIDEEKPGYVRRNTAQCRLLALDVRQGKVIQNTPLAETPTANEYRIEAINDQGLLISGGSRHLQLFRFAR
ncbi:hypothetical protein CCAX7_30060 [Capsulimonas corticalis]|uniref:Uncharacterized protein n=2 Tax=Capsulimonas corticalis TaxID=2219043 RepID=A0A402CSV6_9BACT|nr:hypothetical protein CCAX7_30060 [Capsulimonas corticalis]